MGPYLSKLSFGSNIADMTDGNKSKRKWSFGHLLSTGAGDLEVPAVDDGVGLHAARVQRDARHPRVLHYVHRLLLLLL